MYSRVGLLKALFYMELARLESVHELIRVLSRDKYKMNILGLEALPSDSVFSRFKGCVMNFAETSFTSIV